MVGGGRERGSRDRAKSKTRDREMGQLPPFSSRGSSLGYHNGERMHCSEGGGERAARGEGRTASNEQVLLLLSLSRQQRRAPGMLIPRTATDSALNLPYRRLV